MEEGTNENFINYYNLYKPELEFSKNYMSFCIFMICIRDEAEIFCDCSKRESLKKYR